jgi:hypothetical protein
VEGRLCEALATSCDLDNAGYALPCCSGGQVAEAAIRLHWVGIEGFPCAQLAFYLSSGVNLSQIFHGNHITFTAASSQHGQGGT